MRTISIAPAPFTQTAAETFVRLTQEKRNKNELYEMRIYWGAVAPFLYIDEIPSESGNLNFVRFLTEPNGQRQAHRMSNEQRWRRMETDDDVD